MSSPENVVRARVAKWRPVLMAGGDVKDQFLAGRARVVVQIRPGMPGDIERGIRVLGKRLLDAVKAAQDSRTKIDIRIRPDEKLGLDAVVQVLGPSGGPAAGHLGEGRVESRHERE